MSLHHIRRPEYFFEEAVNALYPGGWLLMSEFVGPSQWQWSDKQLIAINTLLAALPERYRIRCLPESSIPQQGRHSAGPPLVRSHQQTISLQLDQPWSPNEVWGNGDPRMLGVAIAELSYL